MATRVSNTFAIFESAAELTAPATILDFGIRRRIPRQSARAIRLLGHATEYLANEFLHDPTPPSALNPRLQAVGVLMALSNKIYSECPQELAQPSLGNRLWRFLTFSRR